MKKLKLIWTIFRTAFFLFAGLKFTIFIRPEAVGTWENYLGYGLLVIAALDTFFLLRYFLKKRGRQKQ